MGYPKVTKILHMGVLSRSLAVATGTKRVSSQQDLGMAVTPLTATQIENTFTYNVTALTELAPHVTMIKQTGLNAIAGSIRGTGNISILVTTARRLV